SSTGLIVSGPGLPMSSVWPSGLAFATTSAPSTPPAPGRLSITTGCPSASPSFGAIIRATVSADAPEVNGMTKRIGFVGYDCAAAGAAANASDSATMDARIVFTASERRAGCEIVANDLFAGREPHFIVRRDVAERRIERVDAVRDADEIGVQADRHDFARALALAIEHVELAFDHRLELVGAAGAVIELRRIVDLEGVRDRDEPLPADVHEIRLVVVHPVGDVQAL